MTEHPDPMEGNPKEILGCPKFAPGKYLKILEALLSRQVKIATQTESEIKVFY